MRTLQIFITIQTISEDKFTNHFKFALIYQLQLYYVLFMSMIICNVTSGMANFKEITIINLKSSFKRLEFVVFKTSSIFSNKTKKYFKRNK